MYFKEKDVDKFIEYYEQGDGEKQICAKIRRGFRVK